MKLKTRKKWASFFNKEVLLLPSSEVREEGLRFDPAH